jgi:hypothetical protein
MPYHIINAMASVQIPAKFNVFTIRPLKMIKHAI